jgi:hypothetical protein
MAQLIVRHLDEELAAQVRAMIGIRPQTPSEVLLREGRDER